MDPHKTLLEYSNNLKWILLFGFHIGNNRNYVFCLLLIPVALRARFVKQMNLSPKRLRLYFVMNAV